MKRSPQPYRLMGSSEVDPVKLLEAQRSYFGMLGWDDSGVPTREKLTALDPVWANEYIKKTGGNR